jgi:pyridoxine 4-dehydrogenase
MQEIADFRQISMSQVALNWCICKKTIPIPGARSTYQADQNAGALGWRLGKYPTSIIVILSIIDR